MPEHRVATEGVSPSDVGRESSEATPSRRRRLSPSRLVPALAGLAAVAVAQPLLDLLARQPQFLVAHGLSPLEVTIVAVLVVFLPGAALASLAVVGRFRFWVATVLVAFPILLIVLHVGGRMGAGGVLLLMVSGLVAGFAAFLYLRDGRIHDSARYLALIPPVVLVYFFVVLPPAVMRGASPGEGVALGEVASPVPVVIMILDELPVASLIDSEGALLEDRFPAFARLASDGVWYRNAITVETSTTESIPAILSGVQVPDGLVPNAANHPSTLLTMLSSSHEVAAVEPVTELCPPLVCGAPEHPAGPARWAGLALDLAVVYGHLVMPAPWVDRLPPIDENWTGFAADESAASWDLVQAVEEAVERDRRTDVTRFLALLDRGFRRPPLTVAHLALPHRPWEFLPDGSRHGQEGVEGYGTREWGSDEFFVAEGWRRHLLQVGYTDAVVGSVIEELERSGLYQSSMVVVVADHGVYFHPDTPDMRVTNRDSYGSILPVPLFVKYPADLAASPEPGTIDDRRVETTDVAPTVLDVLAADPAEVRFDGVSLLSDFVRTESVLELRDEPFAVGAAGDEKLAVARDKEAWFPHGDPWSLVPNPSLRVVLGQSLPGENDPRIDLEFSSGDPAPPLMEGRVTSTGALSGEELVALTADGVLVAISKVFEVGDQAARFSFLIDPERDYEPPMAAWLLVEGARLVR